MGIFGGQTPSLALTLIATPVEDTLFDEAAAFVRAKVARLRERGAPLEQAVRAE